MKRLIFSIVITLIICFILFTQISFKDLWALLKDIDPFWVILGTGSYLFVILFQTLRFKRLIHSKDISTSELFRIVVFYDFAIMVLPSRLGELSYPYLLKKIFGLNMIEGLASLIASRVYDLAVMLLIFLFASISFQSLFKIHLFFIILLACILISFTLLIFFYMSSILISFSNMLKKISHGIGVKRSKPFQWIQRKIHEMAEDFYGIRARRTYLSVSLTSLMIWIMVFFMCYAFMKGFRVEISFLKVVLGSIVGIVASSLPISGIGNWGTLEAGWAAGFLMVGLSKEKAIATGFGVHILIFIICSVTSLICWVSLNVKALPLLIQTIKRRAFLE